MWPKFKTLEEVPEQFRALYHVVDGEAVYNEPEVTDDKNPVKLQETLKKVRGEKADVEKELKTAQKSVKDLTRDLQGKGTTKEVREEIRKEVEEELRGEHAPVLTERDTLKGEVRSLKLDSQVKALAVTNGVRPERVDRWFKLNAEHFDLAEDGSTPVVKNKVGADVGKYIGNDLKKVDPDFYVGTQASGGGAGGNSKGSGGTGVTFEQIITNPAAAVRAARDQGKTE